MFVGLPLLTHEQQQEVVERIQELMAQGMNSGRIVALVAEGLCANYSGERIVAHFEDEDEQHTYPYRFRYRSRWLFDCEKKDAFHM